MGASSGGVDEILPVSSGGGRPDGARGRVVEIFSTVQGEGLYVGERQVFVRLAGCPWRCRYCDTPNSLRAEDHPEWTVADVGERICALKVNPPARTVAITGGEPLVQSAFLAALLPMVRGLGLRTYLETSATHPALFRPLAALCDVVAADIKLPSEIGHELWDEHEEFFRLAGARAFAKIVLTHRTTDLEVDTALKLLERMNPVPPLVFQPVTATTTLAYRIGVAGAADDPITPPPPSAVECWRDRARRVIPVVRVIPQMHPQWGVP